MRVHADVRVRARTCARVRGRVSTSWGSFETTRLPVFGRSKVRDRPELIRGSHEPGALFKQLPGCCACAGCVHMGVRGCGCE